jgi:endonuclease-3
MTEGEIREVMRRLEVFRASCRPTTLSEVEHATRSPFKLLVSCVISLRTKDQVSEGASRRLLARASTPSELASLPEEEIARAVYPAIAQLLEREHQGRVPASEQALLALPGVGRKTANLVLGLGFGIPAICVDTHVHRISNRLGMVRTRSPEATERGLQRVLPGDLWIAANDLLVTFGQNQCHPTSPKCTGCPLRDLCPRIGVTRHR